MVKVGVKLTYFLQAHRLGTMVLLLKVIGTTVVPRMPLLLMTASGLKRTAALMAASRLQVVRTMRPLLLTVHAATVAKVKNTLLYGISSH